MCKEHMDYGEKIRVGGGHAGVGVGCYFPRVAKKAYLQEEGLSSRRRLEGRVNHWEASGRRAFQVQGTAAAKSLRQKWAQRSDR